MPQTPKHPQNLNGAGFSIWPGLLVGNKLLQPCLVLHREIFPGDTYFSRRAKVQADFLPSSNAYLWNLTVTVANVSGTTKVVFDVHGNLTDPCTGVYFNHNWSDIRT